MPFVLFSGQSAARDDVVNMRMILQLPTPGMQYAEETWKIAADELCIGRKFFESIGRSFEQGRIADALVAADKAVQLLRDGKSDHKMMSRKLSFHLPLQPHFGFMILTGGTMAVAAGSEHRMGAVTFITLVNGHAAALGAAVDDGVDHFSVFIWHGIAKAMDILWCVLCKNLLDVIHDHTSCIRPLMMP